MLFAYLVIYRKGNLEKQVLLEADQIKNEKVIADNRKKIMLARMTNPFGFTTGVNFINF